MPLKPNRAVAERCEATPPARDTASDGGTEEDAAEHASVDISHHGCRVRASKASVYANEQRLCLCVSSHHYLEHRAEDLGVLRHAADVERPGEDGWMVVLVQHFDEDLGCVSCEKKMENKGCSMCLAQ